MLGSYVVCHSSLFTPGVGNKRRFCDLGGCEYESENLSGSFRVELLFERSIWARKNLLRHKKA